MSLSLCDDGRSVTVVENTSLRRVLAAATDDQIVFDLNGIGRRYDDLTGELPGVAIRFAMKACPVDEVIGALAMKGSGVDAASPAEIAQAIGAGVPIDRIHYGNTVKSDQNIADAYALGVRDFATDSLEDVTAIAAHAPGAEVFCRLETDGDGAVWRLNRKCGCSRADAVSVLRRAAELGLTPSGLSLHVGSQQMTAEAWRNAFDNLAGTLEALNQRGIVISRVNLGGGLPAVGYLDEHGLPLVPPLEAIFIAIRTGMSRLRRMSSVPLRFILEPGRHLVADHGAIRAHVSRLSTRAQADGQRQYWLYLSCGKFNGLYENDRLRYRLLFPGHVDTEYVPAVVAGPTCDSDDTFGYESNPVQVPKNVKSGDPVWIFACGAYSVSYMTRGFNGFSPLRSTVVGGERGGVDTSWERAEVSTKGAA